MMMLDAGTHPLRKRHTHTLLHPEDSMMAPTSDMVL